MRRTTLLITAAAMLAVLPACSDRIAAAERRYELVKKGGATADEICARGRDVADAYVEAGNVEDYRLARARTEVDCQLARGPNSIQP